MGDSNPSSTTDLIEQHLNGLALHYWRQHDLFVLHFEMQAYRNPDGEASLGMVITVNDASNVVRITVPRAYLVPPELMAAVARAALLIQTRVPLVRFELPEPIGELMACAELPLMDGTVTSELLNRGMGCVLQTLEQYHGVLASAGQTGAAELEDFGVAGTRSAGDDAASKLDVAPEANNGEAPGRADDRPS